MNDDQLASELRRRAGATDVPDLLPSIRHAIDARPQPVAVSRLAPLAGLAGAAAVVVLLVVALPRLSPGEQPSASTGPVMNSQTLGDLTLTISSPRSKYRANEPIPVEASLHYSGPESSVVKGGSGSLLGFGLRQLDGFMEMGPATTDDCAQHEFVTGQARLFPFEKSGGFSADDPEASFWRSYFDDPNLRLPEGIWELYVTTSLGTADCDSMQTLTASLVITVGDAPLPSVPVAPSPDLPQPESTPPPEARQVDCDVAGPRAYVVDHTGLVIGCGIGSNESGLGDGVVRTDEQTFTVYWTEWTCMQSRSYEFRLVRDVFELNIVESDPLDPMCEGVGVPVYLEVRLLEPVAGRSIAVTINDSRLGIVEPSATPGPGTNTSCAGMAPASGSVEIEDHAGIALACSVTDGTGADELAVEAGGNPARLTVEWNTECHNDLLDTRIRLWHREPTGEADDPSRFQPPYLLMVDRVTRPEREGSWPCQEGPLGRTVEILLSAYVASADIDAFFTVDGQGIDTAHGGDSQTTFNLQIDSAKPEYVAGDAVEISASLDADADITLSCPFGPVIALEQLDGSIHFSPGPFITPCRSPVELRSGEPLRRDFLPAVSALEPPHPLEAYITDGKLYLPPGTYRFYARSNFGIGERPGGELIELEASVVITVR